MNTLSKWMIALAYLSGDVRKPNEYAIKVDGGAGVGVRASPVDGIEHREVRTVATRHVSPQDRSPWSALQYGLIAEEVAKVYPELAIRDGTGRIDSVRYGELAPMLLNEVQQQAAEIRELKQQQKATAAHAEQLRDVQQQLAVMQATFAKLQVKDELVARR
jgi:hypothetical protein